MSFHVLIRHLLTPSFVECLFHVCCLFSNWVVSLFTVAFWEHFVCSRDQSFVRYVAACISSQSVACLFILLTGSFQEQNFKNFGEVQFNSFSFCGPCFWCQNPVPGAGSWHLFSWVLSFYVLHPRHVLISHAFIGWRDVRSLRWELFFLHLDLPICVPPKHLLRTGSCWLMSG